MKGSFQLLKYDSIPVKVHWSFGLLIFFVGFIGYRFNLDSYGMLWIGSLILAMFFCVILHEFGHAIMAKRFGIPTKDIVLSPIGGMARLDTIPEDPKKELFIALAGPMVNLFLAIALGLFIYFGLSIPLDIKAKSVRYLINGHDFIRIVFFLNVLLFFFNLVPAFPMDGGRILRALLSLKFGRYKSTKITTIIAQLIAFAFIMVSIWVGNIFWGFLGMFVFFMAYQESRFNNIINLLQNYTGNDVARTDYINLSYDDKMQEAIELYKNDIQYNFIVNNEIGPYGILTEKEIYKSMKNSKGQMKVSQYVSPGIPRYTDDTALSDIYQQMHKDNQTMVSIWNESEMIGSFDRNDLSQFISNKMKS